MAETIYIFSALTYLLRTLIFSIGAHRERKKNFPPVENFPFVSVIVPARNEEKNISACVNSIAASIYPSDRCEIIVVNDRSTDLTGKILSELEEKFSQLKVLTIVDDTQKGNLKGKSGALHAGAQIASGEIIAMTDADCIVDPYWIHAIVEAYDTPEVGIVASYTAIEAEKTFGKIQSVEWMYNHTLASAGIGLNQPLGCFGNNLSVRKKAFDNVGGYEKISFSVTEDLALLQAIVNDGWSAHYICKKESVVSTLPCNNFREFMDQKHRWAHGGKALGWRATIFVLSSAALWLGIFTALIDKNIPALIAMFGVRIIGDLAILAPTFTRLKRKNLFYWVTPSVIFLTLLELIIPFMLLKKSVVWKGQNFRQ